MSLAHHYARAKAGLGGINPKEATEHGERLLIAGGTGLALGAISAATGGLDKKIAGMNVPVDGLASFGLSLAGLAMRSPELLTASIAAAGSASTRTFEGIFKKGLGAHGDYDGNDIPFGAEAPQLAGYNYGFGDGGHGHLPAAGGQFAAGFGFGNERDRLVEAARAL